MKKTVLALAALAAVSGSAFAQSSVTLYGVVDASLENVKGTDSVTRVSSDNLATSRLGVRGMEDLGGGLKAKFVLESAVKSDTGANGGGTARFWDRGAWVGLGGDFGELRLGRTDSSIGVLAGNTSILGGQAYDDFKIAGTFAGNDYRRVDNSITYLLPTFVEGLTAQVQYSTAVGTSATAGTETANVDTGKAWGFNVAYAGGPFGAGLGYIKAKQDAAGDQEGEGVLVYASYDFGPAKLTGYYNQDDSEAAKATLGTAYDKRELWGLKVGVPVGTAFNMSLGVSKAKNVAFTQDLDATFVMLKGVYTLSKRTSVYGLFTNVDNDNAALSVGGVPMTADKNSHGIAFGIAHAF